MNAEKLLKKLQEENELLEGDHRCHTKITGRRESDASQKSATSANSHRDSLVEEEGCGRDDDGNATPTSEVRKAQPLDMQQSLSDRSTTPSSSPETPVKSKPAAPYLKEDTPPSSPETPVKSKPAAPYLKEDMSESSQASGDEEEEEGEGLGPEASIILDDGLDTRIDLEVVLPGEVGVASGSGLEDETELEVAHSACDDTTTAQPSSSNLEVSRTITLSPAEQFEEKVTKEEGGGSDAEGSNEGEGEGEEAEEESDVLTDLKQRKSSGGRGGTMKRARSETEAGRKVSLSSLVGRVRSQTIQDGGIKDKHLANKIEEDSSEVKLSPEEELWSQWSQLLKSWEESGKRQAKLIKQLARQGIPEHLRGMAWQLLSNSQNQELKEYYPSLITEVSPHERAIQRDLARTFPEHSFFKERDGLGQESLLNVLKAYSVYDREVGYCQGSPFISGLLLMQMPEEDAFCVFVSLMKDYRLRDLYKPSMADLSLCFHLLEKSLEELFPNLYLHFRAVGFQTSMYASPWFLTMFASVLSLNVVFRIVDIYMVEGREIVFRVGLALLEHSHDKLIQLDMEDMLKHFQKEMRTIHEADPDGLINRALRIRYNTKKMKKVEKEFLYRKEKQSQENAAMAKLRAENYELGQRLLVLEKECASLADQLIQGQVKRAEEAEEMIEMRKQLSMMKRRISEIDQLGAVTNNNDRNDAEEAPAEPETEVVEVTKAGSPEVNTDSPRPSPVPGRKKERTESKSSLTSEISIDTLEEKVGKKKKNKKHKKFKPKLKDKDGKHKDSSSLPNSPSGERREKSPGLDINLAKELARAKTNWADVSSQLEEKIMELKQALEREAFVVRELRASRDYVTALEHKLSEVQLERQDCPHCSKKMENQSPPSEVEGAIIGSSEEVKPVDLNSSKALLSHLRSLWHSVPPTNGQDCDDGPAPLPPNLGD